MNKEEIEEYELFKNKYLQQPISLLTKENLELLEQHCQKQLRHEVGQIIREHEIVLELLYRYKKLESREQKLIEKLEEDIREETGYAKWIDSHTKRISPPVTTIISKSQYAKEIIKILK